MRIYVPFALMLTVLLVTGGPVLAQSDPLPTPEQAVSDPIAMDRLMDALPDMSDEDAAKTLADLMRLVNEADMTPKQKRTVIATYLARGLVTMPPERRGAMTAELISTADEDIRVLVVSASALSSLKLLEDPQVLQAISDSENSDDLRKAADEPEAALDDSSQNVKNVLKYYNILALLSLPNEVEPDPEGDETGTLVIESDSPEGEDEIPVVDPWFLTPEELEDFFDGEAPPVASRYDGQE